MSTVGSRLRRAAIPLPPSAAGVHALLTDPRPD